MEITYSTKPLTLGDLKLIQHAQQGDAEATIGLLVARTNLTEEQAAAMGIDDATPILKQVIKGMEDAVTLSKLGEQFE